MNQPIHRIRSEVLRAVNARYETVDRAAAERKLTELVKRDPKAKIITVVPR